jgi:tubulin epsilon
MQGFKVGLCDAPPPGCQHSLLCLANNTGIAATFDAMRGRFEKLFSRQVYVHHYTQYMEQDSMRQACDNIADLHDAYQAAGVGISSAAETQPVPVGRFI